VCVCVCVRVRVSAISPCAPRREAKTILTLLSSSTLRFTMSGLCGTSNSCTVEQTMLTNKGTGTRESIRVALRKEGFS
jgi:hypothetical protein